MAHFIPSAGVHTKGSYNSTTTAFCAPLKKKRRWAPGRLVAEPRGSRFSGCAGDCGARVAPRGDDRPHGVAAEPLERRVRGLHRTPSKRQLSERLRKDSVTLGRSSVHHPLVGTGRQTRACLTVKVVLQAAFWDGSECSHGWLPVSHEFLRHIRVLAAARSSRPPAISRWRRTEICTESTTGRRSRPLRCRSLQ